MPEWVIAGLRLGHSFELASAKRYGPDAGGRMVAELFAVVRETGGDGENVGTLSEVRWVWAIDEALRMRAAKLDINPTIITGAAVWAPGSPSALAKLTNLHVCSKLWHRYKQLKTEAAP